MPHSARSLPLCCRHTRLTIVRRGCKRKRIVGAHGEAMYTAPDCAARAVLQAQRRQWRGQGARPLAFSWGFKGAILSRERMAPLLRTLARCGRTKDAAPSGCPPSAPAGCPKPRSRAYVASAEPRSALKSGRNALHSHPSSQRRRTLSPSFTSKVKTTASSVCALTR